MRMPDFLPEVSYLPSSKVANGSGWAHGKNRARYLPRGGVVFVERHGSGAAWGIPPLRQALFTDLIYQPGHGRMYKNLSVRCQRYTKKKKTLCCAFHNNAYVATAYMLVDLFTMVYYVPRRTMRVIARRATMLAGDRSRGAISPTSTVASLVISRIVCIGTYSILCDFGKYTSFYAYTRI